MKNKGKLFEESIRDSIDKEKHLLVRLNDQPQSFANTAKFSLKNPFDYLLFDSKTLWCLELKSTKNKSFSFEDINGDNDENKMIHRHQIFGLQKHAKYENVEAGFIFNFRHFEDDADKYFETTYYQSIDDFLKMIKNIGKKSFNEIDVVLNGAVKIQGIKKRKRYTWDIGSLIEQYNKNVNKEEAVI